MPNINTRSAKLPWVKPGLKKQESWGFSTNFYRNKPWRNLRKVFLMENPLCIECEKDGKLVTATVVDHIIPRRQDQSLELEWSNLQPLCDSCHNRKSNKEGRGGQNPKNQSSTNRRGQHQKYTCKNGQVENSLSHVQRKT